MSLRSLKEALAHAFQVRAAELIERKELPDLHSSFSYLGGVEGLNQTANECPLQTIVQYDMTDCSPRNIDVFAYRCITLAQQLDPLVIMAYERDGKRIAALRMGTETLQDSRTREKAADHEWYFFHRINAKRLWVNPALLDDQKAQ